MPKALKLRPAARLKLFEHEQSIVYDCDVRKASFNAPLGDAVAERKGFEPLCLLGKRFSSSFGYSALVGKQQKLPENRDTRKTAWIA